MFEIDHKKPAVNEIIKIITGLRSQNGLGNVFPVNNFKEMSPQDFF